MASHPEPAQLIAPRPRAKSSDRIATFVRIFSSAAHFVIWRISTHSFARGSTRWRTGASHRRLGAARGASRAPLTRGVRPHRDSVGNGSAAMNAAAPTAIVDRIRRHLVALKMPTAIERLDSLVQRFEQGQINPYELLE